ncbi:unnamed protein product [Phytophthora fragariaefolia]|uniref:Unnamed protein product n=1 Tax=Phytophthora fragariaefolia TaxID=1490495 RepID=A0A9W7DA31_9STRA|nr:unnamed protein product [Phytophthora fragariaefolia]
MPEMTLRFHDFYDYVHIDAKWFFIDVERKQFYITHNEKVPQRAFRSKRHLLKVMFLVAVARSRYSSSKNQWFNGKIGLWPFVQAREAQHKSKLRARGTLLTVPVSVTREQVRRKLVDDVIPSIGRVLPALQTLQQTRRMNTVTSIVEDAEGAYKELRRKTLDITFLTLMSVI